MRKSNVQIAILVLMCCIALAACDQAKQMMTPVLPKLAEPPQQTEPALPTLVETPDSLAEEYEPKPVEEVTDVGEVQ